MNSKIYIMIIDDDNFNLIALESILIGLCLNVKVLPYTNGLEALSYLEKEIK